MPALPARGGEDHLHDVRQPLRAEEHVLGAAEADAAGAEAERHLGVLRHVGVGADAEPAHLVGPAQQLLELLVDGRLLGLELALDHLDHLGGARRQRGQHDLAGRAVDRDRVAFLERLARRPSASWPWR